ncbi:hypothetical protein COY06_06050 [Candidatus Peregrinibacteria bacterium CG_4_10_14_0_2_um_filter_41_8]|nr:MAG: hypothetical protein COY06_06050 [Candidatus Peregrinibacteria bacterium CG_4_10_14_0_2_um_filter_41_8]
MKTKITKTTSKGQITLPSEWRSQFLTDNFLLEMDGHKLVVKPINVEEVIFDAAMDKEGKGVSIDEMIKLLKKAKTGTEIIRITKRNDNSYNNL